MYVFFFFKQKTAYEMRIRDWSSDVCSSDLVAVRVDEALARPRLVVGRVNLDLDLRVETEMPTLGTIGNALAARRGEVTRRRFGRAEVDHVGGQFDLLRLLTEDALDLADQEGVALAHPDALNVEDTFGDRKSTRLNSSH